MSDTDFALPLSTNAILLRLVSQGLVPCCHNLQLWQHADGAGFGAAIVPALKAGGFSVQANGATIQEALAELLALLNRASDL